MAGAICFSAYHPGGDYTRRAARLISKGAPLAEISDVNGGLFGLVELNLIGS